MCLNREVNVFRREDTIPCGMKSQSFSVTDVQSSLSQEFAKKWSASHFYCRTATNSFMENESTQTFHDLKELSP